MNSQSNAAPISQPAPQLQPNRRETASTSQLRRTRHARNQAKKPAPVVRITRYTAPAGAEKPTRQSVKLGENSEAAGTRQLLEATSSKLEKINRARLSSGESIAYDQARGFVAAGCDALQRDDSTVASAYARKASALAVKLGD